MVNSPLRAPTKMENPEMKTTRCEAPASAGKSSLNPDTLNQLLGQMVNDLGAAVNGAISTLIMAKAFPKSEFYGFDLHPASIETANSRAKEQGVTNIHFSVASAKDFPGRDYEFATVFDALHDMGDPVGAASHVRQSLRPDGTFMIVEPIAADSLAENINPVGRVYYGFSTMVCTPGSLNSGSCPRPWSAGGGRSVAELALASKRLKHPVSQAL